MKSLQQFFKEMRAALHIAFQTFSKKHKIIMSALLLLMIIGALGIIAGIHKKITVVLPAPGGTYTEGIIGSPRFINPVLARSEVDRDLVRLVYSGLMRREGSELVLDLAETLDISQDGKVYTFTLKDNLFFHDRRSLDATDVLFTIQKIQDVRTESPLFASWRGVDVTLVDNLTIQFTLSESYAGFLENTTVGILPAHIWQDLSYEQFNFSERNLKAIGSGPYTIKSIKRSKSGTPEAIHLQAFRRFALGRPYISTFIVKLYTQNEDMVRAFDKGEIQALHNISPALYQTLSYDKKHTRYTAPLPRVFGMYVNANRQAIFLDTQIMRAFDIALNREAMIQYVFNGFASSTQNPFPVTMLGHIPYDSQGLTKETRIEQASALLDRAGWRINTETGIRQKDGTPLSFSLATSNVPELVAIAEMMQERMSDIGVTMTLQLFEPGNLEQDIIRPRNYEALLFGQFFQHDSDIYAFWHSSFRNDPGLNIGLFADNEADRALTTALRTVDTEARERAYQTFLRRFNERPTALFLYNPHTVSLLTSNIQGVRFEALSTNADRFNNIHEWFIEEQRIWKFLTRYRN
ncbi:MAG: peptide ABC transporter substrate-binding protein [Candidatus Pacebacteria bacterium]|nr:peptide ABC transporter substrate-binding protein [Candidatus Paceibacterota bacterium]MCD8508259.1 peptide ABC transporter substrate-binding protein [Candidatus Paceibacterota bacterium]MCD8527735.1 peptide ABC transporter substrate-binding protein [Candidatus Paceibacterota bacterium]MCD8563484.1 peptide ABC transporter substrate-binding protein [Candidatus Paceibacterota bacterium]